MSGERRMVARWGSLSLVGMLPSLCLAARL
jgi:hypothetical protein